MARRAKPWYRADRRCWFVTVSGKRHNLGPNKKQAFARFYELMGQPKPRRSVATKSLAELIDVFLEWTKKHRSPAVILLALY
ncbi:MAG: hypothetical protein H8E66_18720 [Planctomycetes bacterium]|nr:hypothetical protein [Planctomycetota bacterium]